MILVNNVIRGLRYGSMSRIWPACADFLVKCTGPRFAAWLSYLGIDWGLANSGHTILCLSRESFIKDVKELRSRSHINYPMVMGGFTRFQMAWFPVEMQMQTFYQSYSGPGKAAAIEKSTQYARHLINLASRWRKVDGVLSANFDYWQDVGFKKVCEEMEIPFIVLSREHPIVPQACDDLVDWYRRANYKFEGTAIAVAGRSTSEVLARVSTVCNPDQVVITGLPRFDAWLDVITNKPLAQRRWITLLTFTEGYYADETFKEVLKIFSAAAHQYIDAGVTFLVKTKDINDTIVVNGLLASEDAIQIVCTHELDLFTLLPESRLVINYNSLSLVEAAMARTTIVIPAWGECKDRGQDVMYSIENPNVSKVVQFAYNGRELITLIDNSIKGKYNYVSTEDAVDFVNEFIYIPVDGSCSQEFEALLLKCL